MRWKAIMYNVGCTQNKNLERYALKNVAFPKANQRNFHICERFDNLSQDR